MFEISKAHRFEAAHRLVKGYDGNCAHVHGHSWVATFTCRSELLNSVDMARDFSSFKSIRNWIDENLDHATIVCVEDFPLIEFLENNKQRAFIVFSNPTSESLAKIIFDKACELGFSDLVSVQIEETCTSKAIYYAPKSC